MAAVAACSPHLHEKTFRNCLRQCGDSTHSVCEMVSIREQVSWVDTDKVAATANGQSRDLGRLWNAVPQKRAASADHRTDPIWPRWLVGGRHRRDLKPRLEIADAGFLRLSSLER